ncbi:MAG: dTDP-4-dehydrorhamnose reductase [Acholeplasma sp.]|nr:dTDP-4-dehydrorhamnose reductase [Acholeplasma sp.]
MKIIVTGVKGQLGYDVVRELKSRGYQDILGIDIDDLDITNEKHVVQFFKDNNPHAIIHCAAYTAVDKAEDNKDTCMNVNVIGTKNLVMQAMEYDSKFIYISTDYVFDGKKESPYKVNDSQNPQSVYGESKYLGELETLKHYKHFVVRISWVFGKNGFNFVKTMLQLSKEKKFLNIVNDQFGSPTYTYDLSRLLVDLIESDKYGIYHGTNEGTCTWYEFAKEIFALSNIKIPIYPIVSSDYPTKAKRPKNSILDKISLDENGFKRLPDWKDALQRYLKEIEVI